MKTDEEFEERHDRFVEKFNEWWETITLIVLLLSFVLIFVFMFIGYDDGMVISVIVCGISFGLHGDSPLNPGGRPLSRWF